MGGGDKGFTGGQAEMGAMEQGKQNKGLRWVPWWR